MVEGERGKKPPFQGGGGPSPVLGRPQDHDPGVLRGQDRGEEEEEGTKPRTPSMLY